MWVSLLGFKDDVRMLKLVSCRPTDDFCRPSSYASAVLGVVILFVCLSVRPSVHLSVTRVHCDKTK